MATRHCSGRFPGGWRSGFDWCCCCGCCRDWVNPADPAVARISDVEHIAGAAADGVRLPEPSSVTQPVLEETLVQLAGHRAHHPCRGVWEDGRRFVETRGRKDHKCRGWSHTT